jgi:hypothetical protein
VVLRPEKFEDSCSAALNHSRKEKSGIKFYRTICEELSETRNIRSLPSLASPIYHTLKKEGKREGNLAGISVRQVI